MAVSLSDLLAGQPPSQRVTSQDVVRRRHAVGDRTVHVVLDDDPTGTQSVSDLPVLTSWGVDDLGWAFSTGSPAVYVLTNSRSLAPDDAERVNREVVAAALEAADRRSLAFTSRSDSTLRGHFPLEPLAISSQVAASTGTRVDGIVVVPAFPDAGRVTVDGVHYAGTAETGFTPVGETQCARDPSFGYRSSRLVDWVEEKSRGAIRADDVVHVDLGTLRTSHSGTVELLRSLAGGRVVVSDAVDEEDLRLPGIVSLWSGQDGPAAGVPYVVFAGNVGGTDSLTRVVETLSRA